VAGENLKDVEKKRDVELLKKREKREKKSTKKNELIYMYEFIAIENLYLIMMTYNI
tara:strand:+ start:33 stop:200 length:168 start_codon:yes stop_codon:yes gene_type:complete